jgi:hypothetical protein
VTSSTQQLAPALDIDARLTEIERSLNLLLNVTPVNAAEAWLCVRTGRTLRPTKLLRLLAALRQGYQRQPSSTSTTGTLS